MTPFLKQVADLYYKRGEIERKCFVFPNRRSMVFFKKHLADCVASDPFARPMIMPTMTTINDLFYAVSDKTPSERLNLLFNLYDCYTALNPGAEPVDEFIFWGDVILGDFNDVDKYLVNAQQLFTNISDLKQLQDTYGYLSDTQRKAIESFISHFNDCSGRLTVDMETDNPDIKARFLHIWNILNKLYTDFNRILDEKGMTYEGKVYRALADSLDEEPASVLFGKKFPEVDRYVFVGLNALNECEKKVLRKLRDASMAEFCWDWTGEMIRDEQNRSSYFMTDNIKEFGQVEGWSDEELPVPQVNVISVPSSVGQAKRLPDILSAIDDPERNCAVVLPDEGLLVPVLNSIPYGIRDINVTMGLSMNGSLISDMMSEVAAMQLHTVLRKGQWFFYHKHVWNIFSNELFRRASDDKTRQIVAAIRKEAGYYIPVSAFQGSELLETVFRIVIEDQKSRSHAQMAAFSDYLKSVIEITAGKVSCDVKMALEMEFAKEYHKGVTMLLDCLASTESPREILPATYVRLLSQYIMPVSVPFRGEPLKGLQIMGPLETRALDFNEMIILSANEGTFPRRNVSSSFIPPELRKGFGLPTYEYQDAIWAYYFYRMISRAKRVWMLVDSRTEGLKSGEESRYIKQLEYHFDLPLKRYVVNFSNLQTGELPEIVKTEEDISVIRETEMSATALQNYLACPAKFYYGTVRRLKAEDEVSESLDYGMFGTVYHDVMRSIYTSEKAMSEDFFFDENSQEDGPDVLSRITCEYIDGWLKREDDIRRKVKALIARQLNVMDVSGRNLVVTDVIVRFVVRTLQRDAELLRSQGRDYFDILGREIKVKGSFHGLRFKGYVDRLDSFSPDMVRVVDYKTGKVLDDDINIHDGNAEAIAENIFAQDIKERPKIALQFFIYDMLLESHKLVDGRQIYNSVYSTSKLFKEAPVSVPLNRKFYEAVSGHLETLIDEMCSPDVGFRRTDDEKTCEFCDFKSICGR